jgi:hypothetical protein
MLASKHLRRQIQQGGDRGHDSLEDARATGDLVRVKVGEKWKLLKATGWKFVDGTLTPPEPLKSGEVATRKDDGAMAERMVDQALGDGAGRKRKQSEVSKDDEHVLSVGYLEEEEGWQAG